jgi:low affinity Fe/Cu permease
MRSNAPLFDRLAHATSRQAGRPGAFLVAAACVLIWVFLGPSEHYSNTWQLVINTSTTIITFLMVFLIQHSQNRESAAIRLKLDELIRAIESADNRLLGADDMEEEELERLRLVYEHLALCAMEQLQKRNPSPLERRTQERRFGTGTTGVPNAT